MPESLWFQPTVRNRLSEAIVLRQFEILWGKHYDINNPYFEVASAQGTKIESKAQFEWGLCGHGISLGGTEGSFEIRLDGTGETIAKIYWDCPSVGDNKLREEWVKEGYLISFKGFSIPSGALGKGTISVHLD